MEFTPEEPSGTVELTYTLDASTLAGTTIVVFETIYSDGVEIAAHADINDEAQTITIEPKGGLMILSRLVDTFISKISLTMLPVPKPHNTACVLSWEEARRWQSRSSGYSSS